MCFLFYGWWVSLEKWNKLCSKRLSEDENTLKCLILWRSWSYFQRLLWTLRKYDNIHFGDHRLPFFWHWVTFRFLHHRFRLSLFLWLHSMWGGTCYISVGNERAIWNISYTIPWEPQTLNLKWKYMLFSFFFMFHSTHPNILYNKMNYLWRTERTMWLTH